MKRNAFLSLAAIILIGSLSMVSNQAKAALSCTTCQEIFQDCVDAGNSPVYCQDNQPGACYGCHVGFSNTMQKMSKPDQAKHNPTPFALSAKEFLQLGQWT